MNWWLNSSTIAANIATALGIAGFALFFFTHQQNQRQFMFTVMLSCIERFQKLFPLIRNNAERSIRLKKYIDLTNEEFFYFQRGYIPKEVVVEWMDSIIDYFPLYTDNGKLPSNYLKLEFKEIHDERLLDNYPRLKKAFKLNNVVDPTDRIALITAIGKNLGIGFKPKHFRRAQVLSN